MLKIGTRVNKIKPLLKAMPLFIAVFVSMLQVSRAQSLSDEEARERAKAAIRTSLGADLSTYLNPHRIEDLEESVLSFLPGQSVKPLYFFEVSHEGVENRSGQVIVHTSDGLAVQYVAVARSNGQVYFLYGSHDAKNDFNRMADDQHFQVKTEADAELFALFYINSMFGPGSKALLYSSHGLKHMVEDYFYGHSASYANPDQNFKKWWNGFEKKYESRAFGLHAARSEHGFRVEFDKIELRQDELPKVQTISLQITPSGQCTLIPPKPLYPI